MDPHSRQANAGDSSTPALARKPPACGGGSSSATKIKKGPRRRVLADLTNSDSPITGLAPRFPAAAPLCDCSSPGTPGTPGTPGAGEDLLRSQVTLLLQQVQCDVPKGPLFGFHRLGCLSPGMLVGPTPANTPAVVAATQPSTPVTAGMPSSRLGLPSGGFRALGSPPDKDGAIEEGRIQRTISEISKITIAETVVSERHLSLADRFITRSLNFDSLLDDALSSDNVAGDADTASQRTREFTPRK
ncbi:uncharacterized protein LOC9654454 [Selaginella moellendorffii]|uniref:uncharacterized protein LOC9654454 n=1 Tax=Selaginella moellendorffii TaxID=88036 RepID=UPI000D1CA16F|nr:uncharacterized protein LOC9654454 [Selaginella moellendorffii]|eukprot:XP_024544126.1 uncharacterized protein LOC9654454 [Selaginella moellendorffii]